jgi:hypothetical protein
MGTRSLTYIYETYTNDNVVENVPIVCMYRQFDGYVEGHGAELAEFLTRGTLVNGLGADDKLVFNGMGCLAAQMVAHFKTQPGNIYLHAPVLNRDDWQEFEYHVFGDKVIVYGGTLTNANIIFEGDWESFAKFCNVTNESKVDVTDRLQVKEVLKNGEATITFTKVDGSKRVMRCTLDESKIPEVYRVLTTGKRVMPEEVQPVFDLDTQHWKSFRWDSLTDIEVAV